MKDKRRNILKRLLKGDLSGEEAASELQHAIRANAPGVVVVSYPDGSYAIGNERGLSEEQVKEKTRYTGVIYRMPDNGRGPNPGNVL